MLFRSSGCLGETRVKAKQRIVVGLGAAVQDPDADPMLMFGGRRHGSEETVHACRHGSEETVHACPGYGMAMGTMVGTLAALLRAGTLRPDGPYSLLLSESITTAAPSPRPAPSATASAKP